MTKPNNRGVALIAAVVTAVIFMMLVMTVMVVSISTYKKSGQSHDRAMALNLAEAGINDALYQMNYQYYDVLPANGADYPPIIPLNPTEVVYLNEDYVPGTNALWQNLITPPTLKDPFGVGSGNGYFVQFFAGSGPNLDELRSTGIYNGKRRVVSVNIRGTNTPGVALSDPSNGINGIAEAFNKHAVYAITVITGAGITPTIAGNISCVTLTPPTTLPSGSCTVTTITPASLFGVPTSAALTTALPVPFRTYTDGLRPGGAGDGTTTWDFNIDGYGTYNDAGLYTFTTLPSSENLSFLTGPEGVPTVNISSLATINSSIQTSGALILSTDKTIGPDVVFQPAGGMVVSGGITITGDLIIAGTLSLNGVTVDGNVLCNDDITIGNVSPSTVIIDGLVYTSSLSATAVTIGNTTTPDVTINGTVVAGGTVTLNLCTITWDRNPFINIVRSVYDGFLFGRRVYLPVPRSWREE